MVTKPYGAQTQHFLHKNDELGQNCVSNHNLLELTFSTLVQLVSTLTALKIIILYVYGSEKRNLKHIIMDWKKINLENLSFLNLDK